MGNLLFIPYSNTIAWAPDALIYDGTSLSVGEVSEWPDSDPFRPVTAYQSDPTRRFDAAIGLNGLLTAQVPVTQSTRYMIVETPFPSKNVTVAAVGVWRTNVDHQINLFNRDLFEYCSITAWNLGLQFWAAGDGSPVATVLLSTGDVFSAVLSFNDVGQWWAKYQINWGAITTLSGTSLPFSTVPNYLEMSVSRRNNTPNNGELAHAETRNTALSPEWQEALLGVLAAKWS